MITTVLEREAWVAFGKVKAIMRRTGVLLTRDEITFICLYIFHSKNQDEFWDTMDKMSDSELKEVAQKAKLRKPKLSAYESLLYA